METITKRTTVYLDQELHRALRLKAAVTDRSMSDLIDSAVQALDVCLGPDDIAYLEEPYVPHPIVGLIPYDDQGAPVRK